MQVAARSRVTPGGSTRVRKHMSRSNSECEFHARVRRKPCGSRESGLCLVGEGSATAPLPPGLLSCMSMLELSKLDSECADTLSCARKTVPSRPRSLQRINSRGSMEQLFNRIRVPSQRAAMAEMSAAAERIEQKMLEAGRSPIWAVTPMEAHDSPAPLELDVAQLDAVLQPPIHHGSPLAGAPSGVGASMQPPPPSPTVHTRTSAPFTSPPQPPSEASSSRHASLPANWTSAWESFFGPSADSTSQEPSPKEPPPPSTTAPPLSPPPQASSSAPQLAPLPPHLVAAIERGDLVNQPSPCVDAAASSSSMSIAQEACCPPDLVPTAFQWIGGAAAVYLCGTFNGWGERITMHRRPGRDDWWVVLNLPPGEYAYKFVIHDESGAVKWKHALGQPTLIDSHGHSNNWIAVVDQTTYELEESEDVRSDGDTEEGYSQEMPAEFFELLFAQEPPAAPAHLLGPPAGPPDYTDDEEEDEWEEEPWVEPSSPPSTPQDEMFYDARSASGSPSSSSNSLTPLPPSLPPPQRRSPRSQNSSSKDPAHCMLLHACSMHWPAPPPPPPVYPFDSVLRDDAVGEVPDKMDVYDLVGDGSSCMGDSPRSPRSSMPSTPRSPVHDGMETLPGYPNPSRPSPVSAEPARTPLPAETSLDRLKPSFSLSRALAYCCSQPVSVRTTARVRQKFVTIELISPAHRARQ